VGQQFLLSLIIGDTYETYKSFVKKQLKKEKLKEMQGLTKAFTVLDPEKSGTISQFVWKECLNKYSPDLSEEAVALYFELISGGNSSISILQFLSMRRLVTTFHILPLALAPKERKWL
jgi:Ca2+-binding EF-hand superfamily protein